MKKIAIKSNKPLMFPPVYTGTVTMEIDLIQNKPKEQTYELRIIDTCSQLVQEDYVELNPQGQPETKKRTVTKILGTPITRLKQYSYQELEQLSNALNINKTDFQTYTDYINELFRQGLLITTKQECQQATGMYFSQQEDWEIVRK